MKEKVYCIKCGKEEVYARKMCEQCYQADYYSKHPRKKLEDMSEAEWREELRKPNGRCDTKRECHFCERLIPPRFAWCIVCALKMPITICPECGSACYLDDKLACTECGASLVGMEKREDGLVGVSHKIWPEWLSFLKADLDREYRDDIREANQTEDLEDEETGELHKGVSRMEYQRFTQGTDRRHIDKSDLPLAEVLVKYGFTEEEYLIMTTWDLRKLSEKMDITYSAIRKRKERLVRRGERIVLLMMVNGGH